MALDVVRTEHLRLEPLDACHLEVVHAVYSDGRTWQHLPSGRHVRLEQTDELIQAARASRLAAGLGWWAAYLAEGTPEDFVGVGGAQLIEAGAWNLGYRLAPRFWGRGFATEIARAGVSAALVAQPGWAITARVLANNPASERVLLRVGLTRRWEGARQGAQPDEVPSRIYSDRPLSGEPLDWLIVHA